MFSTQTAEVKRDPGDNREAEIMKFLNGRYEEGSAERGSGVE